MNPIAIDLRREDEEYFMRPVANIGREVFEIDGQKVRVVFGLVFSREPHLNFCLLEDKKPPLWVPNFVLYLVTEEPVPVIEYRNRKIELKSKDNTELRLEDGLFLNRTSKASYLLVESDFPGVVLYVSKFKVVAAMTEPVLHTGEKGG